MRPHVVVVSGDLTQDAQDRQFSEAREFLSRLPGRLIVVPGNHDLPFYNPVRRVALGFDVYHRWISEDLEPSCFDAEVAIAGVNTARIFGVRGGRINERQIEMVSARMRGAPPGAVRVLVTHHPFDVAERFRKRRVVGRAALAMSRLAGCIDLLLAGHYHLARWGHTAVHYRSHGRSAIFVQAGTAISTRVRGEPNSFNVIRIDRDRIDIQHFSWDLRHRLFVGALTDVFARVAGDWRRIPELQALRAG